MVTLTGTLTLLFIFFASADFPTASVTTDNAGLQCCICAYMEPIFELCNCRKNPDRRNCSADLPPTATETVSNTTREVAEVVLGKSQTNKHPVCVAAYGHDLSDKKNFFGRLSYEHSKSWPTTCNLEAVNRASNDIYVEKGCACESDWCNCIQFAFEVRGCADEVVLTFALLIVSFAFVRSNHFLWS